MYKLFFAGLLFCKKLTDCIYNKCNAGILGPYPGLVVVNELPSLRNGPQHHTH